MQLSDGSSLEGERGQQAQASRVSSPRSCSSKASTSKASSPTRSPCMPTVAQRVKRSHSRPRVSNDNPFSESNFHTFKSRPDYPARFGSYEDARSFCRRTFDWYNHKHHHSGLVMLTPAQVHYGHAEEVLAERRIHRELQRQAPRRVPRRQLVFRPRARATPLGCMGCRLQRSQTAFCARQWDSATPALSLTFLVGTLMAEAYDSRL